MIRFVKEYLSCMLLWEHSRTRHYPHLYSQLYTWLSSILNLTPLTAHLLIQFSTWLLTLSITPSSTLTLTLILTFNSILSLTQFHLELDSQFSSHPSVQLLTQLFSAQHLPQPSSALNLTLNLYSYLDFQIKSQVNSQTWLPALLCSQLESQDFVCNP